MKKYKYNATHLKILGCLHFEMVFVTIPCYAIAKISKFCFEIDRFLSIQLSYK